MLPPGYKITLYSEGSFKGESEQFSGAFAAGGKKDERLLCQAVTKPELKDKATLLSGLSKDGAVRSIRIEKQTGKAVGYWKGITSTETTKFKYSVGITSSESSRSTVENAQKLNKSLESGWNASVGAEARAGFGWFGGASVAGSGGKSESDKRSEARDFAVASEIASTTVEK